MAAAALPISFADRNTKDGEAIRLRGHLVDRGLLRCVVQLPGRAGIILLIEGTSRRKDKAEESDVLFVTPPDLWKNPSKLGGMRSSDGLTPLQMLARIVHAERSGKLPPPPDEFEHHEPSYQWVSRAKLRAQNYELRAEPHPSSVPGGSGLLDRRAMKKLRVKLGRLETLRGGVDQEMDILLDELQRVVAKKS
jgi:hypothetical protein